MGDPFGAKESRRASREQREMIKKQRQADELKLAEEESEIARKMNLAKTGGRKLLVKTSETGQKKSNNLGGTV